MCYVHLEVKFPRAMVVYTPVDLVFGKTCTQDLCTVRNSYLNAL